MADEEQKPRSPFRQQALEYISTADALDDLIQITPPLAWLLAAIVWLILAAVMLWLCFGSMVINVEGKGFLLTDDQAIVYVSALKSPRLQPGMAVWVSPLTAKTADYRRVSGRVTAVENLPATPENMLSVLKNPSLVNYFLQSGPVFAVTTQITQNPSHLETYTLAAGSLIDVRIAVGRQTPFSLILSRK